MATKLKTKYRTGYYYAFRDNKFWCMELEYMDIGYVVLIAEMSGLFALALALTLHLYLHYFPNHWV